jgi:ABC-type bacteriocin/lantibiotic exporter with double-glycine peptidase domain
MSAVPPIGSGGRTRQIGCVALLALAEAGAAGLIAFATRDVFAAFGAGRAIPFAPLAAIAGGGFAFAALRMAARVAAERLGQDYAADLRLRLFRHVSRMPASEVARRRPGALSMRFVGDLAAVRNWVSRGIARLISAGIIVPLGLGVLFLLDPRLCLAAVVPVALGAALMALVATRLGPIHRRLRARRSRLASDLAERMPHAPELRLLGRMGREQTLLGRRNGRMIRAGQQRAAAAGLLRGIPDAVAGTAAAAMLGIALTSGISSGTTAGALAALGILTTTLRDLAGCWDRYKAWIEARRRCDLLLSVPTLGRSRPRTPLPITAGPPEIRFESVSAGSLRRVDAEARPGRRIAVLAPNGAGKSTLLALAAGLDQPRRGRVRVGGRTPRSLSPAERRRMLHLVTSGSPILAGSLRRALTMGTSRRQDDSAILASADAFGLGPVLSRLGGLDGRVSEQGRNLSMGEAQRIRLARAALSGARVLLLDEPDAGLDEEGPELVLRLLAGSDATCVVATHHRALASAMDEIWTIRAGALATCRTGTSGRC